MKDKILNLVISALLFIGTNSIAQPGLIYYWHFNNTLPSDGSGGISYGPNPLYVDYSANNMKAFVVYKPVVANSSDTGYIDNVGGSSKNENTGFGGCCRAINNGIRLRNPSDNMQFLWYVPTGNYKNIIIKFAAKSSSFKSGMHEQDYSYSIDSGKTFITTGLSPNFIIPDTVWHLATIDLNSISTINDNNKFVFRILFSGNNTGTKGNNRFDNITLEGDIINPNSLVSQEFITGYSLYPNPADDFINLKSEQKGIKTISVYNSIGVLISEFKMNEKSLLINVAKFNPGLYFVNINEIDGEKRYTLKFIKK
jgi:hypothetical protein